MNPNGIPKQVILFRLAGKLYALPGDQGTVAAVVKSRGLTPVPAVSDRLAGAFYFRGRVIPVLSGRILFGLPPAPETPETLLLILTVADGFSGLTVDRAEDAVASEGLAFRPVVVPEGIPTAVRAAGTFNSESVFLLDPGSITSNERTFDPRIEDRIIAKRRPGPA
jgi:chemotaxis signal transduction protein